MSGVSPGWGIFWVSQNGLCEARDLSSIPSPQGFEHRPGSTTNMFKTTFFGAQLTYKSYLATLQATAKESWFLGGQLQDHTIRTFFKTKRKYLQNYPCTTKSEYTPRRSLQNRALQTVWRDYMILGFVRKMASPIKKSRICAIQRDQVI